MNILSIGYVSRRPVMSPMQIRMHMSFQHTNQSSDSTITVKVRPPRQHGGIVPHVRRIAKKRIAVKSNFPSINAQQVIIHISSYAAEDPSTYPSKPTRNASLQTSTKIPNPQSSKHHPITLPTLSHSFTARSYPRP